jgi:hypothetical protein
MKARVILGYYQLIGSCWGLWLLFNEVFRGTLNANQLVIALFFFLLFTTVLVSGLALIRYKTFAIKLVKPTLILQVFQFHLFGFGFSFVSGSFLGITLDGDTSFNFQPLLGHFLLSFEANEVDFFSLNLVPVVLLILYNRVFKG